MRSRSHSDARGEIQTRFRLAGLGLAPRRWGVGSVPSPPLGVSISLLLLSPSVVMPGHLRIKICIINYFGFIEMGVVLTLRSFLGRDCHLRVPFQGIGGSVKGSIGSDMVDKYWALMGANAHASTN